MVSIWPHDWPTSASQSAGVTGMSQCTWPLIVLDGKLGSFWTPPLLFPTSNLSLGTLKSASKTVLDRLLLCLYHYPFTPSLLTGLPVATPVCSLPSNQGADITLTHLHCCLEMKWHDQETLHVLKHSPCSHRTTAQQAPSHFRVLTYAAVSSTWEVLLGPFLLA